MKAIRLPPRVTVAAVATILLSLSLHARAAEDVRVLLELLLEKGVITQEEFDQKLKKVAQQQEIREFNQAQDLRKATQAAEQRAEAERQFRTQIYGQVSAGYYHASNMTTAEATAEGLSDQPKGNNRVGLKVLRELDADTQAVVTLESNFSARTGAVGKDAGASGTGVSPLFDREANLRLISKTYGTLMLGRGPNMQTELSGAFDARQNWNFGGLKAIGRYAGFHSASGINRADRMIRYISPSLEGWHADIGMSFGGAPGDDEQGTNYYAGARYRKGDLDIAYHHIEARLSYGSPTLIPSVSNNRVDFLAAKYTIDRLTINAGVVITRNPLDPTATLSSSAPGGKADTDTYFLGAVARLSDRVTANAGWYQVRDKTSTLGANDVRMIAAGLNWSPYKDWDVFVDIAAADRQGGNAAFSIYDAWRPNTNDSAALAANSKNQSGLSLGAMFKF